MPARPISKHDLFDAFADDLLAERMPRPLIIVGTSKVDLLLLGILDAYLLPKRAKPKHKDELLEGDRPLATFSARIKMSYRLGLIDEKLYSSLETLRNLRNPSAHSIAFDIALSPTREHPARGERSIAISRVDGNHRLHYGNGAETGYSRIEKLVSFCLAYDLTREEEIQLFKDINKNQKPMNTSHLDGIEVRLTPEEELKRRTPELYIAQRLHRDTKSPLHGRIYEGGKKPVGVDIPLRGMRTGIQYMLSRSTQLPRLADAEAQYRVIRNYFDAVKEWQPKAWASPKDYILFRGSGLWAICFLGAHVIDRALLQDQFSVKQILTVLRSGKDWDWSRKGDFIGLGGRAGALEISNRVARKLTDDSHMSTKQLFDRIMAEDEAS